MEGFMGLVLILGIVGVVLSLVMRKKENLIGKNSKTILLVSIALIVVCCIVAAVTAPKEPKDGTSTNSSQSVSSELQSEVSTQSTVSGSSVAASSETNADNPLLLAEWQTAPVMNGFRTEQIGERGYIQITKADLKKITNEQMVEFAEERVKDSGFNWVSIVCGDGTGICFTGSDITVPSYGEIDDEGAILKAIKNYRLKDGIYEEWD